MSQIVSKFIATYPKIKYQDTSGQTVGAAFVTLNFATSIYDTGSLYDGTTFTAPEDGFYEVDCSISSGSTTFLVNDYFGLQVVQTGAFASTWVLNFVASPGGVGQTQSANGSVILQMAAGDTATIEAYSSTSTNLITLASYNYLCISKIP